MFKSIKQNTILLLGVFAFAAPTHAVTYGIAEASFAGATVEAFTSPLANGPATYDFGNGMVYQNISGGALINYTGGYGMGLNPGISSGRDNDGYLGTRDTPASFSLNFAGGVTLFGFSGAEARVQDGSFGRDGIMHIEFYNLANAMIGSFAIDTNNGHAWEQWHGFSSAQPIGSVKLNLVGHSVFDDVSFQSAAVPEGGLSALLLGLGISGLAFARRKQ